MVMMVTQIPKWGDADTQVGCEAATQVGCEAATQVGCEADLGQQTLMLLFHAGRMLDEKGRSRDEERRRKVPMSILYHDKLGETHVRRDPTWRSSIPWNPY